MSRSELKMQTRIVKAEEGLDEAVSLIKSGELVVFPTETVYGLGANAYDAAAVKKIFEAKGRPQDNPLIVHISRVEEAGDIAREIPEVFYDLAAHFMPGALTVVLPRHRGGEDAGISCGERTHLAFISSRRSFRKQEQTRVAHLGAPCI